MRERERDTAAYPPVASHPACLTTYLSLLSAHLTTRLSPLYLPLTTCRSLGSLPVSPHVSLNLPPQLISPPVSLFSLRLPHHLSFSFLSSCLTTCLFLFQDPSIRGIFHFSAKEQMTKYEMAIAIAQAFNLPSNHLIPVIGH